MASATSGALRLIRGEPAVPSPPWSVLAKPPLIGDSLPAAIRKGVVTLRGDVARVLPHGIRFRDGGEEPFDVLLLATGFRAAVGFLDGLVQLDAAGFPRRQGVRSVDQPGLFFVGHTYGVTGAIHIIRREAPLAALEVGRLV